MPEFHRLSVYLDSNVLYSASYNARSDFLAFWKLREVKPVVSQYVLDEVSRNLRVPGHRQRFEALIEQTELISDAALRFIPSHIKLVAKDQQILATAIFARVDYLVTGDINHFGHLYNTTVFHVMVLSPADFLRLHKDRIKL